MDSDSITHAHVTRFITCTSQSGQRAPNKPLLLLMSLARIQNGGSRLIPYAEIDKPLSNLLIEFGPPRKSVHPEYSFWFLQNDKVWELPGAKSMPRRTGNWNAPRKVLLQCEAQAGFKKPAYDLLRRMPALVKELAKDLLEKSFPESVHQEIVTAVGLDLTSVSIAGRDPEFRNKVLMAYGYSCCICGYQAMLDNQHVGIEAAHIKWVQFGGPNIGNNGLALCALHHKLFDLGGFTVLPDSLRIVLSMKMHGSGSSFRQVLGLHGLTMQNPHDRSDRPSEAFLNWHRRQVFKEPGIALD